jgi:hypothetical protein
MFQCFEYPESSIILLFALFIHSYLVFLNLYVHILFSGKKGHDVLIQGGVIGDVARHLVEQYGVPKRYFEILDKTKK